MTLFVFSFYSGTIAQTEKSIHQLEFESHAHLPKMPSNFDPSGFDIEPLQIEKSLTPSKNVFGYLPDWQYSSAKAYLQYDLLSHIAAFDFVVDGAGNISNPSYWPWTDVINAAHSNGVRVVMTAPVLSCGMNCAGDMRPVRKSRTPMRLSMLFRHLSYIRISRIRLTILQ